jgi:DNA polymerase-3 subunit delta
MAADLVASLVGTADPLNPVMLTEDQLRADPVALVTELSTVPMFGGRPVVWIRAGGSLVCRQIEEILDGDLPEGAGVLVAEVESLPPQSTLAGRRGDRRLAMIVEPVLSPEEIVAGCASRHGVRLDPQAIECLLELTAADRGLIDGEMEKLASFAGPGAVDPIGPETVITLCGDAGLVSADAMVATAGMGDTSGLGGALMRGRESGATGHQIAAGVIQRLFRELRSQTERTGRYSGGMTGDDLSALAKDVFELVRDTRLLSGLDREVGERFLLRMAASRSRR